MTTDTKNFARTLQILDILKHPQWRHQITAKLLKAKPVFPCEEQDVADLEYDLPPVPVTHADNGPWLHGFHDCWRCLLEISWFLPADIKYPVEVWGVSIHFDTFGQRIIQFDPLQEPVIVDADDREVYADIWLYAPYFRTVASPV